jgi:hypothetical protein
MTLTYQHFTAVVVVVAAAAAAVVVVVVVVGSLFLSGIYYCLRVFWYAVARMLELELEQRTNIKFLVKIGKSGNEIREC